MGDGSKIEWTDATWNPLIGCSKTSPGCDHCYAITSVHRGAAMGTAQHQGLTVNVEKSDGTIGGLDWTGEARLVPHLLDQPIHWQKPRYIFVNSLSDHLRDTPAAIRWISAEPLLGPLETLDLDAIDWLVVGGESGAKARPMHPGWARDLRDRCLATACQICAGEGTIGVERSHSGGDIAEAPVQCSCGGQQPGTAFLFKQWGNWAPSPPAAGAYWRTGEGIHAPGQWSPGDVGAEPGRHDAFGDALVVNVGKGAAGRELDGRTWDDFPRDLLIP